MGLMRTNSVIRDKVADVVYRETCFVFDTRGNAAEPSYWSGQDANEFESLRCRIPGLEDQDGRHPTPGQAKRAIERLFDKKSYLPKFAWEDPLLRFCYQVGRKNAERLTKIKIEGYLRRDFRCNDRRPAGLGRVMQIYLPVLSEVCKNLRSLTLHMGSENECINMRKAMGGDVSTPTENDDPGGDEGKTDEEKLDRIVGRVVGELRGLKHLQLGDYKDRIFQLQM